MPLSDDLIERKSAWQSDDDVAFFSPPLERSHPNSGSKQCSGGNNSQPAKRETSTSSPTPPPHSSTQTTAAAEIVTLEKAGGSVTLARPLHHCRCGVIR